jgi:hypothetical protein
LTEYTLRNGSGDTIKLNIIVTRSPFNPNGQALQIDPRASDTAAFCNILNSRNGPNRDDLGLSEIRRVFRQAILDQQGSLPKDVTRFTDEDVGRHAGDVMDHFEKACADLAPKVPQAGSTIRMFADGGGPGGRIQSEVSVLNANGALIGHTSGGPDSTSRENYDSNINPAGSGRNVRSDINGNGSPFPAAGSGDSGSPVLRALEKYRRSAAPDGLAPTSAQGVLPATPASQPYTAGTGGVLGKFLLDSLITPAEAASPPAQGAPLLTPYFPGQASTIGDRSGNAAGAPKPDIYPQPRRISSAYPGMTPPDPDQPMPPSQPARPLGIFTGKPMPSWTTPPPLGGC